MDVKDQKYWNILNQAVRLEVTHGHLLWSLSELSRASQVSRPLIYHYFGKSKANIVQEALKLISDEVFGLSAQRLKSWQQGNILESVLKTRSLLEQAPFLREFYMHWRYKPSMTQTHLLQVEKRYKQKLKMLGQMLGQELLPETIGAVFAILFGLVMTPEINEKSIGIAVDLLKQQLSKTDS